MKKADISGIVSALLTPPNKVDVVDQFINEWASKKVGANDSLFDMLQLKYNGALQELQVIKEKNKTIFVHLFTFLDHTSIKITKIERVGQPPIFTIKPVRGN